VDAGRLGGDEQLLADLPVGPSRRHQLKDLQLPPGQAKRVGHRRRLLLGRRRLGGCLEPDPATPGQQLDFALQRRRSEPSGRLVRGPQHLFDPGAWRPGGEQCLGLPEARTGGGVGPAEPLPAGRGRRPGGRIRTAVQAGVLRAALELHRGRLRAAVGRITAGL
jgi:hypothetical protein